MTGPGGLPRRVELVVVGGGVNGCAVARDAALRGISTLLLERRDFGSATSAWCSRLVHGGLKYLETGELRLVHESLQERERLLATAAHLVRPYRMAVPFYRANRRGPALIGVGMSLYDALSVGKSLPRHRLLGPRAARREFRGLDHVGLLGAAVYYDAQVEWPERLCVELALDAKLLGATVLNHAECDTIRPCQEGTLEVGYHHLGRQETVRADRVVNVTGAWTDSVLGRVDGLGQRKIVRASKGSHLVVGPFPGAPEVGVFFEGPRDGRPMLVLPWAGRYLLGSTDLYADGDPDDVGVDQEEVDYILDAVNRLIPSAQLGSADVQGAYVGLRPLPSTEGASPGTVTRDFRFVDHDGAYQGLVSVVGGKLTTHRALAQKLVDHVFSGRGRHAGRATMDRPLPGARGASREELQGHSSALVGEVSRTGGFSDRVAVRLVGLYGTGALTIAGSAAEDRTGTVVDQPTGVTAAELAHAVEAEGARSVADVLLRRTMWAWQSPRPTEEAVARFADFLCGRFGWQREDHLLDALHALRGLGLLCGPPLPQPDRASGEHAVAVS